MRWLLPSHAAIGWCKVEAEMDDGSQKLLDVIDDPSALESFLGLSAEAGSERATLENIVDSLQQSLLEVAGSRQGGASVAGGSFLLTHQLQQLQQFQAQHLQQQQQQQQSGSTRQQAVTFALPHTAVSSAANTAPSSAVTSVPVSTHHFVLTPFPAQTHSNQINPHVTLVNSSTSQAVVVSSSQHQGFIYTPVTASTSGIPTSSSGISIGPSGTVLGSSSVPVSSSSAAISLGSSGIQIGSSGMPVGPSGITIGPSGLTLSNIPASSSSTSVSAGAGAIFGSSGISVGSGSIPLGSSGVLVGPSGAVFPTSGIAIPTSTHAASSPGSPFSVPTRSPASHGPPTPSPSPLPLRSPASVPPHPPSPAPSPYHTQLQSPQNQIPSNSAGFLLSTTNSPGNLLKDAFTNLPLVQPQTGSAIQGTNSANSQTSNSYVLSGNGSTSGFKDAYGNLQQQASSSVVVLPRQSGTSAGSMQVPSQNTNSPSAQPSYSNMQSPQSIILSHSSSIQTCPVSVASQNQQSQSTVLSHNSTNNLQGSNPNILSQHLTATSGSSIQSSPSNNSILTQQHLNSSIQSPQSSVLSGNGSTARSPAPAGGSLTPAPSPSPQHRTVPSPVIRSTTPTPGQATVIHQTLPAGLALSGTQQFPVMQQGSAAMLQTSNHHHHHHQLLQIFHQSPSVPGANFPAHTQIITTAGPGAPVHLHAAAATPSKPKQPPQILPKPPSTSGLAAGSSHTKLASNNRANIATTTPQGLHSQHHGATGTQMVIGQANQAAMIPAPQGGTLLLNQVIPGLSPGPVLVQQNTSGGVQFILRPPTPGTQTQAVGQTSQAKGTATHHGGSVLISGHGGTQILHNAARQQSVQQQQQQQQQVLRLIAQAPMHLQPFQTASGPTLIAVPSGQTLSFQHLPHLATSQQTPTPQQPSRQPNTPLSLQASNNLLPAVINNIHHSISQSTPRSNTSVPNLNISVPNLNISSQNSSSSACGTHSSAVLSGQTVSLASASSLSSVVQPSHQSVNTMQETTVTNNYSVNNSGLMRSSGNSILHQNTNSDLSNNSSSASNTREATSNAMGISNTLPPPKKKPKKKKKKKKDEEPKLDLANIMKLSGIGDEDDIAMLEPEEQPNQQLVTNNSQTSDQSHSNSGNQQSQLITQLHSPLQSGPLRLALEDGRVVFHPAATSSMPASDSQVKLQTLGTAQTNPPSILLQNVTSQQDVPGLHQQSLANAHSQLSALLAAHGSAGNSSNSSTSGTDTHHVVLSQLLQQQTPPPSSPHLISTGTNTTTTRTSGSASPSSLSTSQVNPTHLMNPVYTCNNSQTSQSTNVSSSERYEMTAKVQCNFSRDAFTEVPIGQQQSSNITVKNIGKIEGNMATPGSSLGFNMQCKAAGNDLKDAFTNLTLTPTPAISGKISNTSTVNNVVSSCLSNMSPTNVLGSVNSSNSAISMINNITGNGSTTLIPANNNQLKSTQLSASVVNSSNHAAIITSASGNTSGTTNMMVGNNANISTNFISTIQPGVNTSTLRNCSQIDTSRVSSPVVASSDISAKMTTQTTTVCGKISCSSPPAFIHSIQQNVNSSERTIIGTSTTTQTENLEVPTTIVSTNTSIASTHLQLSSQQSPTKTVENHTLFLPVSSTSHIHAPYGTSKTTIPNTESTHTFLGLHTFPNLQGLVSSTNVPLMATLPPISSNAPSGNSNFGPPMTYTGTEPLVFAHQGGISIAGPQLLQCLQQAHGQQTGLINMSPINALSKVLGSTPGLFNAGTILIGGSAIENFGNHNQQKSSAILSNSSKFIPQQSMLLQQLNSGPRRCSSDSNSSISIGSPPPVIGLLNQPIVSQQSQNTTNQTVRKINTQQSTETQTVSIGIQNSSQNHSNLISGFQSTFLEGITQPQPNLVINKAEKPIQYGGIGTVSKKKKKKNERSTPKPATSHAVPAMATVQQPNQVAVASSTDSIKAVLQERLITKSTTNQNIISASVPVVPCKSSTEVSSGSPSFFVTSPPFTMAASVRGITNITGSVAIPPLTSLCPMAQSTSQTQPSNAFCHLGNTVTSTSTHLTTMPIVSMSPNLNKITMHQMSTVTGSLSLHQPSNQVSNTIQTGNSISSQQPLLQQPPSSPQQHQHHHHHHHQQQHQHHHHHHHQSSTSGENVLISSCTSSQITVVTTASNVKLGVHQSIPQASSPQQLSTTNLQSVQQSTVNSGINKNLGGQQPQSTAALNVVASTSNRSLQHMSTTQSHSNHLNPTLPHLVPIPPTSIAGNPGSSQGVASIGGLQTQISGNLGGASLLPGSIFQKVHTIQLTPQNQKQLKAVQMQIQSIMAKKNQADEAALHRLVDEQQRILATGKVVPTIPGQHAQGLQFSTSATNLATMGLETQQQPVAANVTLLQGHGSMTVLHAQLSHPSGAGGNGGSAGNATLVTVQPTLQLQQQLLQPVSHQQSQQLHQQQSQQQQNSQTVPKIAVSTSSGSTKNLPSVCEKGTSPIQVQVGTQTVLPCGDVSPRVGMSASKLSSCSMSPTGNKMTNPMFSPNSAKVQVVFSPGNKIQPNFSPTSMKSPCSKVQGVFLANSSKPATHAAPVSPPSSGMLSRGIKRPATSPLRPPISRGDLIEQQLKTDQAGASLPDTQTPFTSTSDACKRLIRYHVFNEQVLSQQDLEKADEIFEATAKHLLDKFRQMMNKYRYLLLMESMREVNTSELIMIDRMFVAEEHVILERLKEEERKAKEDPVLPKGEPCSPVPGIKAESGNILSQGSHVAPCSTTNDLREVRVLVQDVMKNESIKRELEEDHKFTVVKREKLELEETTEEQMDNHQENNSVVSKSDHSYDEWEEIQKELGVFCPSGPSSSVATIKSEKLEDLSHAVCHLKMETDSSSTGLQQSKSITNLDTQENVDLPVSVSSINSNIGKRPAPLNQLEVLHNSDVPSRSEFRVLSEDSMQRTSNLTLQCEPSDDPDWVKKFPTSLGGVKNRCGVGGPRDEGGGESSTENGIRTCVHKVSSSSEADGMDRREVCDSVESVNLLPKKKRHKHGPSSSHLSSGIEGHFVRNNVCEMTEEVCDDDEINAQVQSAIDSILNLQRNEDGLELPSSTVVNTASEVNVLDVTSGNIKRSDIERERQCSENRGLKTNKCLKGDNVSISRSNSPEFVQYSGEVDHFTSRNSDTIIPNGRNMEDDSSGNTDSALDEAVRSILTS